MITITIDDKPWEDLVKLKLKMRAKSYSIVLNRLIESFKRQEKSK